MADVVKIETFRAEPSLRTEMHDPGGWEAIRRYMDEYWNDRPDAKPSPEYMRRLDGAADYLAWFLYNEGFVLVKLDDEDEPAEIDEEEAA